MKISIKQLALMLILAVMSLGVAQAATPAGTLRSSTTLMQGGSNSSSVWRTPAANTYKVFVQVLNGTATNARYRVYPKGISPTNPTVCSSTDANYPCFELFINQALNQNKWVQLTINSNVGTKWSFTTAGYVAVYANTSSTTERVSAAQIVFQPLAALKIGQTYQGGIIFYLDSTKFHGLVAAPTDVKDSSGSFYIPWNTNSYTLTIVTDTAVGTGKANTAAIIAGQLGAGSYAAKLCDDLVVGNYTDWYLPSKDELNLMYTNIGQGAAAPLSNVGGFVSYGYWSSSDYYGDAWYQSFYSGLQGKKNANLLYVRAVRTF